MYSIQNDFPNHKVDTSRLTLEIQRSAITIALDHISTSGDDCSIVFKDDLSADNQARLAALVAAHSGDPLPENVPQPVQIYTDGEAIPGTADGRPKFAVGKTDDSKKTIISHDWTDPTTWIEGSTRAVDEVVADSGDHLTYNLAHAKVIDTYHGKVSQEDFTTKAGNSLRVAVKVNGAAKTEQDPHYGSGGDYIVDYALGKVTFFSALDPADEVKVTYHYAGGSAFTIKPDANKSLTLEFAECQFSADVEMTDSVVFQPYGLVDVFAPQLVAAGVVPSGTKIPLGNPVIYKAMSDFQNDAVKSYPIYPVIGGSSWRGSSHEIVIFDWDYVSSTVLRADYGLEIKISLQHDVPFGGWYATATFYCTSGAL